MPPSDEQLKEGILICLANRSIKFRTDSPYCFSRHYSPSEIIQTLSAKTVEAHVLDRTMAPETNKRVLNPYHCRDVARMRKLIGELQEEDLIAPIIVDRKHNYFNITETGAEVIGDQFLMHAFETQVKDTVVKEQIAAGLIKSGSEKLAFSKVDDCAGTTSSKHSRAFHDLQQQTLTNSAPQRSTDRA